MEYTVAVECRGTAICVCIYTRNTSLRNAYMAEYLDVVDFRDSGRVEENARAVNYRTGGIHRCSQWTTETPEQTQEDMCSVKQTRRSTQV